MDRRLFTKNILAAGAAMTSFNGFSNSDLSRESQEGGAAKMAVNSTPFKMKYAPHFGMFENSAGKDLLDQLQFMYDNGFRAMEDNGMMGRTPEMQTKIGEKMAKLGMEMGVFVISFDNWPPKTTLASGNAEWREKFLSTCREAVNVAKRVNAKWATVVPGNFDRTIPMGYQMSNVIESLRQASAILEPHNLTMVLEPLSDNPDLFMRFSDQTYLLCKAVKSPSCKILFDMWHMQRNEGNLIDSMNRAWDEIAYFQIGDNPGRKEPTTGEINYKNIFKHIDSRGFKGVLGMEHGNFHKGKEGEMKLIEAYRNSDL
jgi:hydroxypyruvate isomerase